MKVKVTNDSIEITDVNSAKRVERETMVMAIKAWLGRE